MDIAALSMNIAQTNVLNQVNIAMLSKSLDTTEAIGDGLTKMLEQSVTPSIGGNIDVSI